MAGISQCAAARAESGIGGAGHALGLRHRPFRQRSHVAILFRGRGVMRGIRTAAWHLLWGVMALWIYSLHANAAADGTGAPTAMPAIVQQPRPFGYVLGDTLTQRIFLQSAGHDFE